MSKKTIKIFVLLLGVSFFLSNVKAQAKIEFAESVHDFGTISEKGGLVSHEFEFVNVGNAPLVIQRVSTSCGCTSPNWTKTPVEPKGKGKIKVTFNPNGRPYPINKTITVYSNASNKTATLKITGNVEKFENLETDYPYAVGNGLRLKFKNIHFGIVNKGNQAVRLLTIANESKKPISVNVGSFDDAFTITVSPDVLKPKEKGFIRINLNTNKLSDWGDTEREFPLIVNGKKLNNTIRLTMKIVEDFSRMPIQEKRKAPIAQFKSKILEFGKIKKGKVVTGKTFIKNVGVNALKIRKISNSNPEIRVNTSKTEVKSGQEVKFNISIDTKKNHKGEHHKSFVVLTNDPMNSEIVYIVKYTVL